MLRTGLRCLLICLMLVLAQGRLERGAHGFRSHLLLTAAARDTLRPHQLPDVRGRRPASWHTSPADRTLPSIESTKAAPTTAWIRRLASLSAGLLLALGLWVKRPGTPRTPPHPLPWATVTLAADVPLGPAAAGLIKAAASSERFLKALRGLNEPQRQAVETLEGPLLVLAGAGTGKTKVLTMRVANIIRQGLAGPGQIFAVTFTNKAAREMQERIEALIGVPTEGLWIGTFHSLACRLLRYHAKAAGFESSSFSIIDESDQMRMIRRLMPPNDGAEAPDGVKEVTNRINRWKDRGLGPSDVKPKGDEQQTLEIYSRYQAYLAQSNAADFGDLLMKVVRLFEAPDIQQRYGSLFRFILVDEYQDTNHIQHRWLHQLAQSHRNLCCVGDDDQSIYGFRGAVVANILNMPKEFPELQVVRLEQNYRSTPHIVQAAAALINHNPNRLGKTLWTAQQKGMRVFVQKFPDCGAEAKFVAAQIAALVSGTAVSRAYRYREIAVLTRINECDAIQKALRVRQIPFVVVGGANFFKREEVRVAMAYLTLCVQPFDGLAFERAASLPRRGVGSKAMELIMAKALAEQCPFPQAARSLLTEGSLKNAALSSFLRDVERWMKQAQELSPAQLLDLIWEESGLRAALVPDPPATEYGTPGEEEARKKAKRAEESFSELRRVAEEFDTLAELLQYAALANEDPRGPDADLVVLMTVHKSKGLEFPVVFLPGWESGTFPSYRATQEPGGKGVYEERRLAYVALTRARDLALITHCARRTKWARAVDCRPSPVHEELPDRNVRVDALPKGAAGARRARR